MAEKKTFRGRAEVNCPYEGCEGMLYGATKKCPVCGIFIEKNEGCEWMMCGTKAHGSLKESIKNGGCGIAFNWDSLAVADDPCGCMG